MRTRRMCGIEHLAKQCVSFTALTYIMWQIVISNPFYHWNNGGSEVDQWNHRDGSLVCRGTGYNFGQSELHSRSTSHFVSMDIPEERTVEYISPSNTCAILDNGRLMCWGNNYYGEVGDGSNYSNSGARYKYSPVYTDLGEGRTAIAVDGTCAILDNGAVKCWGQGGYGQLGDGSTVHDTPTPVSVSLPAGRTAVALAGKCVILDNASVMCWGSGSGGALGNANSAVQTTPVYVDLGTNRTPVKIASYGTTCVVFDDGSLTCWGGQSYGETLTLPVNYTLPAGRTAFDVAIGEEDNDIYVYVHLDDNRVCRTASYNDNCDYVEYGRNWGSSVVDTYESTDLTAVAISAGDGGLCAVLVNGMLRCTDGAYYYGTYGMAHTYDMVGGFSNTGSGSGGHSSGGMTGITGATCTVSPALPAGLSIDSSTCTISGTPTAVASNTTYTIVATLNNVNYQGTFWLSSSYYELIPSIEGADLLIDEAMTNITFQYNASAVNGSGGGGSVTSSLAAQNIAGGRYHTCAIVDNGSVACWGNSDGQLGDGTTTDRSTPTITTHLVQRTAVQVATGDYFTCVMLDNDEVKCWGDNQYGQLGDGTTTDKTSPPSSAYVPNRAVALVAGDEQACAIMDDESLTCWGRNEHGELGHGGATDRTSPTAVSLNAGENVIDVGSGMYTPAPFLTTGASNVGGGIPKASWEMAQTT